MALEYLVPNFVHDLGRLPTPDHRGELKYFNALTEFDPRQYAAEILSPAKEALQIEAKPTMWSQAETFRMRLDEIMRENLGPEQEEFQVWSGLLAAIFQGDLQALRLSGEDIDTMDDDLRPALVSSLPFDPEMVDWPGELASLHRHGSMVLLVAGRDQVALGGGYAPCLVFPARRRPLVKESRALSVFENEPSSYPDLRLSWLMERYARQPGFASAFARTIRELERRCGGGGNERLKEALILLRETVQQQWAEDISEQRAEADCMESEDGVLPYRFRGPGPAHRLQGGAAAWERYRLQAPGQDGRPVLLIPENVDPHLNPWVEDPAFPGEVDVHTRYKDLRIHRDPEGRGLSITGRNGATYQVPGDYHVLSLDPQAPPEHRSVLDAVMFLDGEDRALRNELLDPVHDDLRHRLTSRDDITLLVPLHIEILRHFPQLAQDPRGHVRLSDGSIGDRQSESVGCSLSLQLGGGDRLELAWRASLMAWKHSETRLPQTDVWPALRSHPRSRVRWSAYFLRTRHEGESLAAYFHGESRLRRREVEAAPDREDDGSLHTFDFLEDPPRLAEVFHKENPSVTLGLLFLNRAVYRESELEPRWDLAIDFGTTNTSVAFRPEGDSRPQLLCYGAWSRPIIDTQASEIIEREPHPGWFLEDLSHLRLTGAPEPPTHSGFFSTLLALKKWLSADEERLARLRNPADPRRGDLAELLGTVEIPGFKPNLAMRLLDGSYSEWEMADGLKWSTGDGELEARRKAYRTIFLELLLLHAAVECYARTGAFPKQYHFSYPLSMPQEEVKEFKIAMSRAPQAVEGLADPSQTAVAQVSTINESQAAFRAFLHVEEQDQLVKTARAVLIDMGGGSADYAVFTGGRQDQVAFLDSLHLAGDRFFQFLRDIAQEQEHRLLARSVEALFEDRLAIPSVEDLKKDQELRRFRREYNVVVCAEMPGKGGGQFEQDSELVRARVDRTASELRRKIDAFSAAHWMRALFKTVVTHGLLLGVTPIDGRPSSPEHLDLVLLGNGWGLLHHAGVPRDDLEELVRDCYRHLRRVLQSRQRRSAEDEPPSYPEPEAVSVRFMDEQIGRAFGAEIFSKDVISIGAILAGEEEDSSKPLGILGHGIRVRAVAGAGREKAAQEPIHLPWHLPVEKRQVDSFVNEVIERRARDAPADDPDPFARTRVISLDSVPFEPDPDGGYCLLDQLLALELLRTGGYAGRPEELLESRDWASWNQAVNDSVHQLVQAYGDRARGEKERFTSLITDLWEYSLTREIVRRKLFERMQDA